jgi:hypothetical protein
MEWISTKKKVPLHMNKILVKYAGAIRVATHNVKDATFRFENGGFISLKLVTVEWAEIGKSSFVRHTATIETVKAESGAAPTIST